MVCKRWSGRNRGDTGRAAVETLEPRCLLATFFGPAQSSSALANAAVLADVDGDGVLDRVSASGPISLERGAGDGTFLAPTSGPADVSALTLAAGRFRGLGGPVLVAAISHYAAPGTPPQSNRFAGYALSILGHDVATGGLNVRTPMEVPFPQSRQSLESPGLLVGDVRAGPADELVVSTSIVSECRGFFGEPTQGRVVASVFAMPADDRLELKATLMDRALAAPIERFRVPRTQLADVNNDGRTDVLVRPVTAWRAELGPAARTGPASQQGFKRRAIPGSDEAAAGGRFLFLDANNDGRTDRVLIRTALTSFVFVDQAANEVVARWTFSVAVSTELGLGGLAFGPRSNSVLQPMLSTRSFFRPDRLEQVYPVGVVWTPLIGDVDGDGLPDVVMTGRVEYEAESGVSPITSMEYTSFANIIRNSAGQWTSPQLPADAVFDNEFVRFFQLADVNGESRPDLLVSGRGSGLGSGVTSGLGARLNFAG